MGGSSPRVGSLIDKCIQGEIAGVILFIIRKEAELCCLVAPVPVTIDLRLFYFKSDIRV